MTDPNQNNPELDGVLADAVNQLRQSSASEVLLERCLANALSIDDSDGVERVTNSGNWLSQWAIPLAIAASVIVMINIAQSIARQPPPDRELCAILQQPDGQRLLLYSDRRIEPALNFETSNRRADQ